MIDSRLYLAERVLQAVRDGYHTLHEITAAIYRIAPDHPAHEGYAKRVSIAARKLAEAGRLVAEKRKRFEQIRARGGVGLTTAQRVFWYYSLPLVTRTRD